VDNKVFPPGIVNDIIKKGYIILKPLRAINFDELDDIRRAEAAALRSL
jgi:hypothetical protein